MMSRRVLLWLIYTVISVVVRCEDGVMGKHYHRMHNTHNLTVEKPWMLLKEVDGLMNEDVAILVSSSVAKQFSYLRGRIIPSARTWMKMFANVFVIVEDTFQARYAMRFCSVRETEHFTSFDCRHEPTYVLSRKCLPTQGGGPGPCCKVDELFTYLIMDRPELFSHLKYAVHCDDDTFFRSDQVLRYFAQIEASGVNTFPIVGSPNLNDPNENVYGTNECEEIHTNGWYQPFFINHAAMERAKFGFAGYGVMETCNNFEVTHDVGMGPFFWEFQMYRLPFYGALVGNHGTDIGFVLTHAVKHGGGKDACDNRANYGKDQQYKQQVLLGCGAVNEPMANHKAVHGEDVAFHIHGYDSEKIYNVTLYPNGTMLPGISTPGDEYKVKIKHILSDTDVIDANGKFNGDTVEQRQLYIMMQLVGYETTKHSKENDVTKQWKSFQRTDCAIAGYGGPKKPRPKGSVVRLSVK